MARVSARQAYTRAKSKRQKTRAESQKAMVEARLKYVKQLTILGVSAEQLHESKRSPRSRTRQTASTSDNMGSKKITDYFPVTRNLDLMHKVKSSKPMFSSSLDPSGVETITIYDSEQEDNPDNDDNNNNSATTNNSNNSGGSNSINNENLNTSWHSSLWDSSYESNNCDQSTLPAKNTAQTDLKPFRSKVDNLGTSLQELKLKFQVDEEIEIVEMLPPIPLRNHPVFEVDE